MILLMGEVKNINKLEKQRYIKIHGLFIEREGNAFLKKKWTFSIIKSCKIKYEVFFKCG